MIIILERCISKICKRSGRVNNAIMSPHREVMTRPARRTTSSAFPLIFLVRRHCKLLRCSFMASRNRSSDVSLSVSPMRCSSRSQSLTSSLLVPRVAQLRAIYRTQPIRLITSISQQPIGSSRPAHRRQVNSRTIRVAPRLRASHMLNEPPKS